MTTKTEWEKKFKALHNYTLYDTRKEAEAYAKKNGGRVVRPIGAPKKFIVKEAT